MTASAPGRASCLRSLPIAPACDDVNNWLGRSQYVGDPDFGGQLHEFRIYARALSDAEVQGSYDVGPDPTFF